MSSFSHARTIRFPDTDAAGVVYFANYLSICHEAYEESLAQAGLPLATFFSDNGISLPISESEAKYLRPLTCGDRIRISVQPRALTDDSFEVLYEMSRELPAPKIVARVRTVHVAISPTKRERVPLPEALRNWIRGDVHGR